MSLYLVPLRARHVRRIAPHLREQDQAEALALDGRSAFQHLMDATDQPGAYAIIDGSVPCGACGIQPWSDETAIIWMVGTPRLTQDVRQFIKATREVISEWHLQYPALFNWVHTGNTKHIRWLYHMGATFGPEHVTSVGGMFREFYLCANPHQ